MQSDLRVPDDPAWQTLAQAARDPWTALRGSGRPLLGLACSRLPDELAVALDLQPWRLRPAAEPPRRASALLQGFCCSFLQGLLHQGLGTELEGLAALTLPAGTCDSMRAFPALWRAGGARPRHLYSLRLPAHSEGAAASEMMAAELSGWLSWLEGLRGERLQPGRLEQAARVSNQIRAGLRRLREQARLGLIPFRLVALAAAAAQALPRSQAADLLERAAGTTAAGPASSGPRLALCGGLLELQPLLDWLDRHGALVTDEDTCALGRTIDEECDLDPEQPLADLAARQLRTLPCPVALGSAPRRLRELENQIGRNQIDGVVLLRTRGCEAHAFDSVILARGLQARGTPHLVLELEPWEAISGQIATRLEAFLEMLVPPGEQA